MFSNVFLHFFYSFASEHTQARRTWENKVDLLCHHMAISYTYSFASQTSFCWLLLLEKYTEKCIILQQKFCCKAGFRLEDLANCRLVHEC